MHIRPDQPRKTPGRRSRPLLAAAAALGIAAACLMSAAPADASLATDSPSTDSGTTTAIVDVTSAIILSDLTPSFTLTGVPGDRPVDLDAVTFDVFTNNITGYNVTVQPENAFLVATNTINTDSIPISDISVRDCCTIDWTPLNASSPVTVHRQSTRSAALPGDELSNDYEFNTPIPDVQSDTYTDVIDYVATTNP
jgi:hypothetical protein